jgi:hypothetical protein
LATGLARFFGGTFLAWTAVSWIALIYEMISVSEREASGVRFCIDFSGSIIVVWLIVSVPLLVCQVWACANGRDRAG